MKRIFILAIATLFAVGIFSSQIFAVEYGINLSTNTDFKFDGNDYDQAALEQKETLTPYIKVPFNDTAYFATEASVTHKLNDILGIDYDGENSIIVDLTLLKFNKTIKFQNASSLELSIGRMFTTDSTAIILSQSNDGLALKYNSQKVVVGAYFGYSGLQNIKDVEMLSSSGYAIYLEDEKKVYDFAAPYLIGSVSVAAPYLFAKQTLSFEALGVFKSGGPNSLPDDEENRIYATLGLNGPFVPTLFYNASITVETNDFSQAALLAKFGMVYYAPVKDISVGISVLYASGENGGLSPFVAATKKKACLSAEEPTYSGILNMGLSFSIVPVKSLLLSIETDVVFNMMEDPDYYGFQAELAAKWNIFSDLQLSFGASEFVGKEDIANRTEFYIGCAIAF